MPGDDSGSGDYFDFSASANSDGAGVDLTGEKSTRTPRKKGSKGHAASTTRITAAPVAAPASTKPLTFYPAACNIDPTCVEWPGAQLQPQPGAPAETVTITDLARFLPATTALRAEPAGWAVVGVPANFVVDAEAVVVDGELLGDAAQVRFTPRRYRWDYGDGSSRSTLDPGATWAELGQAELTTTPTSHVYRARGDLSATVTVEYSAEYRVADGAWTPVAGAVAGTAPPVRVLVVTERTVLTDGDAVA